MKKKSTPAFPIQQVLHTLVQTFPDHPMDTVTQKNPFKVLIGCIISLRTKDEVTIPACERLFAVADTPHTMAQLDTTTLGQLIYPAGFYKTKAQTIQNICQQLVTHFNSQVPDDIDTLLTFKGVGRKTANLVVGLGHGKPAICVDIHVHRICNRLGYVQTTTPEATEWALREKLPLSLWSTINWVLVRHGQEICKPVGARCDVCPIEDHCAKHHVKARKPPKPPAPKT
ncbi:MAG: endonuclease III [Vampirovibrionales bacterium]